MKNKTFTAFLTFAVTIFSLPLFTTGSQAASQIKADPSSKLIGTLNAAAQSGTGRSSVIIMTNGVPSLDLKSQVGKAGGRAKRDFKLLKGFSVELPNAALTALAKNPNVKTILPERNFVPLMDITTSTVGATYVHSTLGYTGAGVGVAVIDSGVSPHEDLMGTNGQSRIVYSENFVTTEPTNYDLYGHGTHVAGIIAGNGAAATGGLTSMEGMAPKANILNFRVLDSQGRGTEGDLVAAIERAIALKSSYNIRVLNMSIGAPVLTSYVNDPLCQAVELAWNAGIVVVVAAGNFGTTEYGSYGFITSPGNAPSVLTVGATNSHSTSITTDDTIASYSSRGPTFLDGNIKPDIVAPGNRIRSLMADNSYFAVNYPANRVDPSYYYLNPTGKPYRYFTLSGTSMATPVVSGAVALMIQKDPALSNHTVKLRLMATASKVFAQTYDILTIGAGRLDVAAVMTKYGTSTSSRSPRAVRDQQTQIVLAQFDDLWITQTDWAAGLIWGSGIIWGGLTGNGPNHPPIGSIPDSGPIWANGVIWGSSSAFEDPDIINASSLRAASITGDGD